jgi:hypothetical protein
VRTRGLGPGPDKIERKRRRKRRRKEEEKKKKRLRCTPVNILSAAPSNRECNIDEPSVLYIA